MIDLVIALVIGGEIAALCTPIVQPVGTNPYVSPTQLACERQNGESFISTPYLLYGLDSGSEEVTVQVGVSDTWDTWLDPEMNR